MVSTSDYKATVKIYYPKAYLHFNHFGYTVYDGEKKCITVSSRTPYVGLEPCNVYYVTPLEAWHGAVIIIRKKISEMAEKQRIEAMEAAK